MPVTPLEFERRRTVFVRDGPVAQVSPRVVKGPYKKHSDLKLK